MTPEERAALIWNASSQSRQDQRDFILFVAEHIAVAETEAANAQTRKMNELRAEITRKDKEIEIIIANVASQPDALIDPWIRSVLLQSLRGALTAAPQES